MLIKFNNIQLGLNEDVDVYALPATPDAFVWSDGKNIRFLDEYVQKFTGHSAVFGASSVAPYYLLPVTTSTAYYWLYAGLTKVYVTNGTVHTNITRQTTGTDVNYTGSSADLWTGGVISGIPVITNGVDDPQMWSPTLTGTKLSSLTWSSGQTWSSMSNTAQTIKPFKNYLVALDTTESATRYPYRVRWSTSTNSGIPSTWDETDPTEDAGFAELNQSGGFLVDCLPLRDSNIIYKEDAIWAQTLVNGNDIFNFRPLFESAGILGKRCVMDFYGKHIAIGNGDVFIHDGNTIQSIVQSRYKNWLFNQLDSNYYSQSFIVPNHKQKEVWICFPSSGSTLPDTALIWNYHFDKFYIRDLPGCQYIGYGIIDNSGASSDTWASDSQAWGLDNTPWGQRTYNPTIIKMLMAYGSATYQMDDTNQFAGTSFNSYIERTGIDLGDPSVRKLVRRIYPRMTSTGSVTIKIGGQEQKNGSITWESKSFNPSTDEYVSFNTAGKFIGIRFEDTSNISWDLHSFSIEYEIMGRF